MISPGAPRHLAVAPGWAAKAWLVVAAVLKIRIAIEVIEEHERALDHVMQVPAQSPMAS